MYDKEHQKQGVEQIRTVSGSYAVQLPAPRLSIYYMTEGLTPSDQVSINGQQEQ